MTLMRSYRLSYPTYDSLDSRMPPWERMERVMNTYVWVEWGK